MSISEMARIESCGMFKSIHGKVINDNQKNASGVHIVRQNPYDGSLTVYEGSKRNYVTNPLSDREKEIRATFTQAAALRSMVLQDSSLKATWAQRFKLDTVTTCKSLNGYIMSMAAKGHIDSDGSYK